MNMYLPKKTVVFTAVILLLTVTLSGCINLKPTELPTLQIHKEGDEIVNYGSDAYYDIYVEVHDAVATNVIVTELIPEGMTFKSSNPTPTTENPFVVTWELGVLEEASIEIYIVLTAGDQGESCTNTVSITCDEGSSDQFSLDITLVLP